MKFVNRGYLIVQAKEPFMSWANQYDEDFTVDGVLEPNIYLIEEDFFEEEPIIKANYKHIFENELYAVTDNLNHFPPINFELFENWFDVKIGSTVFDTQSQDLTRD